MLFQRPSGIAELIALRAVFIPCCISLFPGDKQGSAEQA